MEDQNRVWELLAKRGAGELSREEEETLNALLGDKKEDLNFMMNILENYASSIQKAPETPDIRETTHRHKENLMKVIEEEKIKDSRSIERRRAYRQREIWIWAAAIGLLLVGGWSFLYFHNRTSSSMNIIATERGNKTKMILPDGTLVWLNAETKLSYPGNFKEADKREVTLCGEAYFKVTYDPHHPFIIHTKYLDIKDLGTIFNVRAYPDEEKSEATLIKGAITVSLKEDPAKNLLLKPGEKITYFVSNRRLTAENTVRQTATDIPPIKTIKKPKHLEVAPIEPVVVHPGDTVVSETAWLNNQLIFNNEDFSELVLRMSRHYNVNIQIKDKAVKAYSFTGIFEGESLEQALKELQMIRPFSYEIEKDEVVINK